MKDKSMETQWTLTPFKAKDWGYFYSGSHMFCGVAEAFASLFRWVTNSSRSLLTQTHGDAGALVCIDAFHDDESDDYMFKFWLPVDGHGSSPRYLDTRSRVGSPSIKDGAMEPGAIQGLPVTYWVIPSHGLLVALSNEESDEVRITKFRDYNYFYLLNHAKEWVRKDISGTVIGYGKPGTKDCYPCSPSLTYERCVKPYADLVNRFADLTSIRIRNTIRIPPAESGQSALRDAIMAFLRMPGDARGAPRKVEFKALISELPSSKEALELLVKRCLAGGIGAQGGLEEVARKCDIALVFGSETKWVRRYRATVKERLHVGSDCSLEALFQAVAPLRSRLQEASVGLSV